MLVLDLTPLVDDAMGEGREGSPWLEWHPVSFFELIFIH
jgi:hypothetical protein